MGKGARRDPQQRITEDYVLANPNYTSSPMSNLGILPAFDPDAFGQFINGNGVPIIHWKAIPCPVGQHDVYDTLHKSHVAGHNCSNGYIYIQAGEMIATFNNNPNQMIDVEDIGIIRGSTVMITFPFTYCDGVTPVVVSVQDRFYVKDIECTVVSIERFARGTGTVDPLDFPPTNIEYIIDQTGKMYNNVTDYTVIGNMLTWVGDRPTSTTTCAVRYNYTPYLYCSRLMHEIRVARVVDGTGTRSLVRMPYAGLCQRENVGRNVVTNLHPNQKIGDTAQLPSNPANNNLITGRIPLPNTGGKA